MDFKMLLGAEGGNESEISDGLTLAEVEASVSLPDSFLPEEKWPKCKDSFYHIRNQGKCGSCWAQAAASMLDGRICIKTDAKFTGWVSPIHDLLRLAEHQERLHR